MQQGYAHGYGPGGVGAGGVVQSAGPYGQGGQSPGPYGPLRPGSGYSTPTNTHSPGVSLEAISALLDSKLDNKLGPLQSSVESLNQSLQGLTTRMTTNEQGLNWTYSKIYSLENTMTQAVAAAADTAVKKYLAADLEIAALEVVEKCGADVSQSVEKLQEQVKELQKGTVRRPKGRSSDSQYMTLKDEIDEVKDKIEFRFDSMEPLPATDEDAKNIINEVLGSVQTDMAAAHAEFHRKYMIPQDEGAQQLRLWIRLPTTAERNVLFAKLTTREITGKWTSHITYKGNTVEARRPELRSRKFMMTKLISESKKFAEQNGILPAAIKQELPIDSNSGTVKYKNKVVIKWDFADREPVWVK